MLDAWDWCTGPTQRDGMGREEGGGFRMYFLLKIKKKKKNCKDCDVRVLSWCLCNSLVFPSGYKLTVNSFWHLIFTLTHAKVGNVSGGRKWLSSQNHLLLIGKENPAKNPPLDFSFTAHWPEPMR